MPGDLIDSIRAVVLGFAARLLFGLPDGMLRRLFGRPPAVADGLMPDAWALCRVADLVERTSPDADPVSMRVETDVLAEAVADRTTLPVETEDLILDSGSHQIDARLYRPESAPGAGPLLIWFHGGGWVVGSIRSHDRSCRLLAHNSGVRILAVDYRLAPEHPFPAAADDALAAWRAVQADHSRFGAEPGRVAVGGDSAGGNLAAVVCQDLMESGERQPRFQLLVYPVTEIGSQSQSMKDFATGFYLTQERMDWYDERYAPDSAGDRRASPLKAEDLSGLAPAYVNTCLADPLRDEGEQYARQLMTAGVKTRLDRFPLVHAWFNQTLSRSFRAAHDVMAARVRQMFEQNDSSS